MTDGYMKMLNKLKPEKLEAERERIKGMKQYEEEAMEEGYDFILGVDEVGRGPLCGPVVTACCVLDMKKEILFLNDSKKLSEKKRDIMSEAIKEEALCYAFGESSPELIDEINILNATKRAMKEAIEACYEKLCLIITEQPEIASWKLAEQASDIQPSDGASDDKEQLVSADAEVRPEENELGSRHKRPKVLVLIDGNQTIEGLDLPQRFVIKGDASSVSIAAASILAKVRRDRMMVEYDELYPGYGFAKNKGYGTKEHLEALESMGPTPIHRMSFVPKSKTAVGLHYEKLAAKLLKLNGYELLSENYRTKDGEIDVVAAKDGMLCFIEVKYRSSSEHGYPSEAVDKKKQERIYKSALHYISDLDAPKTDPTGNELRNYRFDVVEIEGDKYRILPDAFQRPKYMKRNYFV